MDSKKLLLGTIGGAIAFYFAGFLIWGLILEPINSEHSIQYEGLKLEQPRMLYMILSMIVYAFLYTLIFLRWARIKTFLTGAKTGSILAALYSLGTSMLSYSMMNLFDSSVILTDLLGNVFWGAIGGGIIGWILGLGE